MKEKDTIKFENLSGSLKTFVVLGWIVISIYAFAFFIGVIEGIMYYS